MTGLFHNKYRVAIYDENSTIVQKIAAILRSMFDNVEVSGYTDTYQMFMDLNVAKAKNKPFDVTVLGPHEQGGTSLVLKQTDPKMEILTFVDEATFKKQTSKFTLRQPDKLTLRPRS